MMTRRSPLYPLLFSMLLLLSACAAPKVQTSQAFTIAQNQKMVPIIPFTNTLVPAALSESVFNDFVDGMNDKLKEAGFSWFGIVKDDIRELEKILSPAHIYITGEVWSYIEDAGCCSTEMRIKSRLRINRVRSKELLWEAEIPLESFFEHDASTAPVEREKLSKRLSAAMAMETLKALQNAKRITLE